MNTDNMAISGETIDYGPCAFMEGYAPDTVFSSIDRGGRYAYDNQPQILTWNLARLAETLVPLFDADEGRAVDLANAALDRVAARYHGEWLAVMRAKLGLTDAGDGDGGLIDAFLRLIEGVDWTQAFRSLGAAAEGDTTALRVLTGDAAALGPWLARWQARLAPGARARIEAANPVVIPRNHLVEEALAAAHQGDLAPFEALLAAITDPFRALPGRERFALPAPVGLAPYVTFCGT
jgi:serine/tyrosine/threonine adenylyltransferase